jgi:hypothetical protein
MIYAHVVRDMRSPATSPLDPLATQYDGFRLPGLTMGRPKEEANGPLCPRDATEEEGDLASSFPFTSRSSRSSAASGAGGRSSCGRAGQ